MRRYGVRENAGGNGYVRGRARGGACDLARARARASDRDRHVRRAWV